MNENTDVLSIDSFTFEHRDRDDGRSGGGILVYVSNQIWYKRRSDLETKNGPETTWLEIVNLSRAVNLSLLAQHIIPPPLTAGLMASLMKSGRPPPALTRKYFYWATLTLTMQ